ncbi:MAG: peptidoglycan editing factor PgeF [Nitrospiraceae bacterium]|nr:peptidoglycan editing factor PgeF [Nitrospiraceae bacterium]
MQKHTDRIIFLSAAREPGIGDAVITREKGVLVGVQVADCVPVLVHEKGKKVVAAVHAGWRGTASAIVKKTVEAILDRYAGEIKDIVVAIGPAIGGCSYEVGGEVVDAVGRATGEGGYYSRKGEKYYLDLPSANRQQVLSLGVPPANVWVSPECTFCAPDRFYSYRFSKGVAGRQGGFIGLL